MKKLGKLAKQLAIPAKRGTIIVPVANLLGAISNATAGQIVRRELNGHPIAR